MILRIKLEIKQLNNFKIYYVNLKKYITGKKMDIKDLFFCSNGKLAIWVDEPLNINLDD